MAAYSATDPDAKHSVRWSLSGRDASRFLIGNGGDVPSGQLRFRASPDFEAPGDSGRDNVYDVTVVATDTGGNTASRDVTVKVTNAQEPGHRHPDRSYDAESHGTDNGEAYGP